ncbi:hypothetical protein IQ219_18690 [Synechocystis sp. LEGE 06083]|nr:hypothetical protein [Synechocystis sp. LEGE 06083]
MTALSKLQKYLPVEAFATSLLKRTVPGIAIHRIEKGHDRSISYTEKEMAIAAERDIEVR